MKNFIIDFHTHAFPDKIAKEAMEKLSETAFGKKPYLDGTIKSLLKSMKSTGIIKSVVASIATKETQVLPIYEWSKNIRSDKIYPLLSIHPDFKNFESFLQEAKNNGFSGIKLHPMYQNFILDEKRMFRIYEAIENYGFFILFHTGFDIAFPVDKRADIERIPVLIKNFKKLNIIASHFGGWKQWKRVLEVLSGKNVYLETSMSLNFENKEIFLEIIKRHDKNKIFFGTDSPWSDPKNEVNNILSLKIPDKLKEKILFINADNFLRQQTG